MDGFEDQAGGDQCLAAAIAAVVLPTVPLCDFSDPGLRFPGLRARNAEGENLTAAWLGNMYTRYNAVVDAVTEIGRLEARTAALKTRAAAELAAISTRIETGLGLDRWQSGVHAGSTAAEIAAALKIPEQQGDRLVTEATTLTTTMTATLAGLEAGLFSFRHAQIIVDEVSSLTGIVPAPVREAFETRLLTAAPELTAGQLRTKARRWREKAHPESITTRHTTAREQRNMSLQPARDAMSWLTLYLPAETGQGIWNRATTAARAAQNPTETRTLTQLRLDAATHWLLNNPGLPTSTASGTTAAGTAGGTTVADGAIHTPDGPATADGTAAAAAGRKAEECPIPDPTRDSATGPRATILVTVPVFTLMGLTEEPAELEGYGPIPPEMARKLAAEAPEFIRLLIHPHTGEPLALGHEHYKVPRRMRLWLRARDRTCTFPGCTTVTADTQLDHLTAHAHGGTTDEDDLSNECRRHHYIKHLPDGKDRHGRRRTDAGNDPETDYDRESETAVGADPPLRVRGWTPP